MFYTLIGIIASFIVSMLFYLLSCFRSFLFIDLVTDYAVNQEYEKGKSLSDQLCYNSIFIYKNIGIKTADIGSYAKKDSPKLMQLEEGISNPFGSYRVMPPGKLNINDVSVKEVGNDLYLRYEYLQRKQEIVILLENHRGLLGYRATNKNGIDFYYTQLKKLMKVIKSLINIMVYTSMLYMAFSQFNTIWWLHLFLGVGIWFFVFVNLCYQRMERLHRNLVSKYKDLMK